MLDKHPYFNCVGCAIERLLNVNKTLMVLNQSNCRVNTGVPTHIFRSLEKRTSLEELDLSENSQLAKCDNEALGCVIQEMLNVNRTLEVLNPGPDPRGGQGGPVPPIRN